jgi:protein-S-isoprenylcysteine O-methyltransferase Ste14
VAPLPYTDSGAKIALYVVLGIFVVLEQRLRLRSWVNREGSRIDRGSLPVVILFVVAGVVGGFALAAGWHAAAIPSGRWPLFIVGLVLMSIGIAIRQWSIAVLGSFFTVDVRVHPDQAVVERGPYRWVRHPSYTGLIITFVGIGLALGNWAALAVLIVVPSVGLVVRIRLEERALLEGLGEPYSRFAAGRARLFPGLW